VSRIDAIRRAALQLRSSARHITGPIRGAAARFLRVAARSWRAAVSFWGSVRPTTRRGAVLGLAATVGGASLLAVVFFVGATVAWSPYLESSVHPGTNARTWAALEPSYARDGTCAGCHAIEAGKAATASHAGITCQSCHGALLGHSLASPGTAAVTAGLAVPTDEVCVRCHASAAGRPESLRQVEPARHYISECLQCHDPHTGISRRPPVVLHTLENLPPCTTCHGPEGFKARNQRHPAIEDDALCLPCHAAGRGPEDR
jgi:hypothetical protein